MPDTLLHQPDLIGGNRVVVDDMVADSIGRSPAPTRISQTLGAGPGRAAPPPIARRLTILVIVAILPLLAFAAFMIANDSQAQRAAYREQLQATSRAASFAIDAEIARQEGILKGLSAAPELKNHDWRAFHDLAKAAIADEPGERVNLIEPSGMFVMSTLAPFGTDLGPSGAPDAYGGGGNEAAGRFELVYRRHRQGLYRLGLCPRDRERVGYAYSFHCDRAGSHLASPA